MKPTIAAGLLLIGVCGCDLSDPATSAQTGLVDLAIGADSIPADSVSFAELTATLRDDTDDTVSVTFRVSGGTIPGGALVKAKGNQATALLVSGVDARTVIVTASARDFQATDSIRFFPAAPSRLILTANRTATTADGSSSITLTVELLRPQGRGAVSLRTPIAIVATDGNGNEVRDLRRLGVSGDRGVATFPVTSTTAGEFRFIASAKGLAGDVADTLSLTFQPK